MQDCVDARMACMQGFDLLMVAQALIFIGALIALTLAVSATFSIAYAQTGVLRGVLWFVAVWALPVLGAAVWLLYARKLFNCQSLENAKARSFSSRS